MRGVLFLSFLSVTRLNEKTRVLLSNNIDVGAFVYNEYEQNDRRKGYYCYFCQKYLVESEKKQYFCGMFRLIFGTKNDVLVCITVRNNYNYLNIHPKSKLLRKSFANVQIFPYLCTMIFYFSGVGNSALVASQLAEKLGDKLVFIVDYAGQTIHIEPGERIGFVFPIYSWAPPKIMLDFIARVQISSPPSYIYFVCTCGSDTGKTPELFSAHIQARGWHCHSGYSIAMPNTYVAFPGFGVDKDRIAQQKISAAKDRITLISKQIQSNISTHFDCNEGGMARFKTYTINPLFNQHMLSAKPFYTTDACIGCKKCENTCPVHNIHVENGRPSWGENCTQCTACFHACPQNAIQYGRFTKGKKQYRLRLNIIQNS